MKRISKILWGVVLIAAGILFALNAFEITNVNIFFSGWWTLFIIVPCAIGLFTDNDKVGSLIGILVGVILLLCCQGVMSFGMLWKLILPAIIVIVGLKLILNGFMGNRSHQIIKELHADGKGLKNGFAAFSGSNLDFNGEIFEGAELTAVFGGVKCDLTNAIIERDCVINATAIFGGVDIFLPYNVNVKVTSTSVFGGVSDSKHRNSKENAITVYVNGSGIFGGVEIK